MNLLILKRHPLGWLKLVGFVEIEGFWENLNVALPAWAAKVKIATERIELSLSPLSRVCFAN